MKKLITFVVGGAVALVGLLAFNKVDIKGLDGLTLHPHGAGSNDALPEARTPDRIRVASFNIQVFGQSKINKAHVMDVLARIARNFDVIAIQEIRAKNQDILPTYVDLINQTGRHYDYVIGPRLGRTVSKEQYAFVFDTEVIEVDRNQMYTVADPDDLIHREPLVAWFRVRGPPPEQAFTFSLVNIHTDPDEAVDEVNTLADVYRVVHQDGRGEDDIIVLGDLNVNDRKLGRLAEISGMQWVVSGVPTNTRGTSQYDNIVFQSAATTEFTGRGGVFDFLREYNLSMEEALEVSDHIPVWAEFTATEGGQPGRFATRPDQPSPF